jgi:hypothetical protein
MAGYLAPQACETSLAVSCQNTSRHVKERTMQAKFNQRGLKSLVTRSTQGFRAPEEFVKMTQSVESIRSLEIFSSAAATDSTIF